MQKWMAIPIGLLGLFILIILFELPLNAVHNIQTDAYTQAEASVSTSYVDIFEAVATGAGVTTADVVLTEALWDDDVANVVSITSTHVPDTPTADSYVSGTKTLTVGGLIEAQTRTLTVTYKYKDTADVVLDNALWENATDSVLSISSTQTETPTASSYVADTKTLTVGSLSAKLDRDLTIKYEHDALTKFTGFGSIVAISPLILWLAMIGVMLYLIIAGALSLRRP